MYIHVYTLFHIINPWCARVARVTVLGVCVCVCVCVSGADYHKSRYLCWEVNHSPHGCCWTTMYFRRKDTKDKGHFLPGGELPKEVVESENPSVLALEQSSPAPKHKKTTTLHTYNATRRADIGKYSSCKAFSKVCGHNIPESAKRKFRDAYLVELKSQASTPSRVVSVTSLPTKTSGRPLLLWYLDQLV